MVLIAPAGGALTTTTAPTIPVTGTIPPPQQPQAQPTPADTAPAPAPPPPQPQAQSAPGDIAPAPAGGAPTTTTAPTTSTTHASIVALAAQLTWGVGAGQSHCIWH